MLSRLKRRMPLCSRKPKRKSTLAKQIWSLARFRYARFAAGLIKVRYLIGAPYVERQEISFVRLLKAHYSGSYQLCSSFAEVPSNKGEELIEWRSNSINNILFTALARHAKYAKNKREFCIVGAWPTSKSIATDSVLSQRATEELGLRAIYCNPLA